MPDSAPSLRPEILLAQSGWVRGLARALVFDSNRVDDVVQNTWLAALEQPSAEVGNLRAWLAGIVRNVVRQEKRGESRRVARERGSRGPEPLPPVAELVERADLQKRVVQAVLELDEPQRSTLLLRYFEDLSAGEIARRLGVPGSTVRSRLQAALEALRERFDRERGGDRRAWSLGLIPLLLPRGSAGAGLVSTASNGVLVMTIKCFLVTLLAVGSGFGASYAYKHARPAGSEPAGAGAASTLRAASIAPAEPELSAPEAVARQAQEGKRQPVAPQEKTVPVQVKGRVVDLDGQPASGVAVFVGGQPSPFGKVEAGLRLSIGHEEERRPARGEPGEEYHEDEIEGLAEWAVIDPERLKKHGAVLGKTVLTDAAGRFEVSVPAGARVYVTLHFQLGFHKTGNGAWHQAPAEGIELRVQRVPTAELSIWVTDLTTGKKLAFAGELFGADRWLAEWEAQGELVRRTVEVPADVPDRFRVEVTAPLWARTTKEFHVTPGVENPVELLVQSGAGLPGQVVDALGQPVEGAFVYWGDLLDLRQSSLFQAYEPGRVVGGVRTDSSGRFTLPGTAARLSAWHPDHSPSSVTVRNAPLLVLPARGAIRGVVLDEQGLPAPGKKVVLDRSRETVTDAQGAYAFERVETGVHGVAYWPERFVGVEVAPGETIEITPQAPVQPRGQVTSGGAPFAPRECGGVILGLGRVFSVSEWGIHEGRLEAGSVRAGRNLLMSNTGVMTIADVQPDLETMIELGTARVTIEAPNPDDPVVYLLPEEASTHPAAHFWARRFFAEREGGRIVYSPLPAGRYVLVVEGRETRVALDLAEGEELVLARERWMGTGSGR